ncbi:MAG TPA: hypothetical protein VFJ58_11380 [Armatimonadota bacterium]|nr:hypothetical protein [Armatimonadota bacterium]
MKISRTPTLGGVVGLVGGAGISSALFRSSWGNDWGYVALTALATCGGEALAAELTERIVTVLPRDMRRGSRMLMGALTCAGQGVPLNGFCGGVLGFVTVAILCPGDGQAIFLPMIVGALAGGIGGILGLPLGAYLVSLNIAVRPDRHIL